MTYQAKLEDSNVALIGSDADIEQRVKAAKSEKEWEEVDKIDTGLMIWRIEKFNVKKWPKDQYGSFFDGDSYIVLAVSKSKEGTKLYDIHFWQGSETSIDERGVSAYKTVELDDFLGGKPREHREVQGHESELFASYFNNNIVILKGGIDSGFNKVTKEEFKPLLFHIYGKRFIKATQVPVSASSLNKEDAFVLATEKKIYVYLPSGASKNEKYNSGIVCSRLQLTIKGHQEIVYLKEEGSDEFWKIIGGSLDKVKKESDKKDDEHEKEQSKTKVIYKLSDESGKLKLTKIIESEKCGFSKKLLDTKDVFIIDAGDHVIAWVGKAASSNEKKYSILCAEKYLSLQKKPKWIPIHRVQEGQEGKRFKFLFSD